MSESTMRQLAVRAIARVIYPPPTFVRSRRKRNPARELEYAAREAGRTPVEQEGNARGSRLCWEFGLRHGVFAGCSGYLRVFAEGVSARSVHEGT